MLTTKWQTPQSCLGGVGCLEARLNGNQVEIRSTRNPARATTLTPEEWLTFLNGVKAGEFDIPAE